MDFMNDFCDDAKILRTRKNKLSPFLSVLLYCFGRLGAGVLVPIVIFTFMTATVVFYGFDSPNRFEYWYGIIIVLVTVVLSLLVIIGVRSLYKKSKGTARLVFALQSVSDALRFESKEIDRALRRFDRAKTNIDKVYALNYIYLTNEELLGEIDSHLKDFTQLKDTPKNREVYEVLVALAEKVEVYKAKCEANRMAFIDVNNLNASSGE